MINAPATPVPSETPDIALARFAAVLRRFRPETSDDAVMSVALSLNRNLGTLTQPAGDAGDVKALLAIGQSVHRVVEESGLGRRLAEVFGTRAVSPARPVVLVVDDATDVLVTLGAFLEGAGFEVMKASGADAALRMLSATPSITALVTDLAMPGMSGVDLVNQALELRPGLPSVIVTAFSDEKLLASLPATTRVLRKPFRRIELVQCVRELVAPPAVRVRVNH